jgi:GNAT superfamily N-acetyltransferase
MVLDDTPAVAGSMRDAFVDLARRMGGEPPHWPALETTYPRIRHLIETDPQGAWVAVEGDRVVGSALALVREGVWGLSLLVVLPSHQSGGAGRALLERTLAYAEGCRGAIILASEDPRALRAYSRAGFAMRPAVDAVGPVKRRPDAPADVRPGRWPEDRELVDRAGRAVRGAGHGADVPAWLAMGGRLFVHDGGGFAVVNRGELKVLAAGEPEIAAALLRAALREVPDGTEAEVEFITAGQDWAVPIVLEAGLDLRPAGAVFVRGDVGPMAPYLPSSAYL